MAAPGGYGPFGEKTMVRQSPGSLGQGDPDHLSQLEFDFTKHKATDCRSYRTQVRLVDVGIVRDGPLPQYTIATPQVAADCVPFIKHKDREALCVLHLDSRHRICSVQTVSVGTLNDAHAHPREIFKAAILSNAEAIILAHNHPSGVLAPSKDDDEMTQRIIAAGELLAITVLDHIIVGPADGVYSYRAAGRFDEFQSNTQATTIREVPRATGRQRKDGVLSAATL